MTTKKGIARMYNTSDAEMLVYVGLIHSFYMKDLADFTAFDPDFNAAYGDDFLTAINKAQLYNSDNQLIDVGASATMNVEEKMIACRDFFHEMKYFIEKSFPKNRTVWNEFGYNSYKDCRRAQLKMIQFMFDLHQTAVKYADTLATANFDASKIAEIKSLAEALQIANIEQAGIIKERSTKRSVRVGLMNDCWEIASNIRRASKVIYVNNWGKWQMYLVPWGTKHTDEPELPDNDTEI